MNVNDLTTFPRINAGQAFRQTDTPRQIIKIICRGTLPPRNPLKYFRKSRSLSDFDPASKRDQNCIEMTERVKIFKYLYDGGFDTPLLSLNSTLAGQAFQPNGWITQPPSGLYRGNRAYGNTSQ